MTGKFQFRFFVLERFSIRNEKKKEKKRHRSVKCRNIRKKDIKFFAFFTFVLFGFFLVTLFHSIVGVLISNLSPFFPLSTNFEIRYSVSFFFLFRFFYFI